MIVLHLEMLIGQLGHIFAGSSDSLADLQSRIDGLDFDVALVDIDLADGRTGGDVVRCLRTRSRPSIFVTGQDQLAGNYTDIPVPVIMKPITADALASKLNAVSRL